MFEPRVAVVGLGYVGLPVAVAFGSQVPTIGFDIDAVKIARLKQGGDPNGEVSAKALTRAKSLRFTGEPQTLRNANFIIVAVPTPVTATNVPDLSLLESASRTVGQNLGRGSYVIFESTVYPGVTEDVCRPIIETESGLVAGKDFFLGYSPERINPGDDEHTLERIVKVVAGDSARSAKVIASVYRLVCPAGIYIAPTIKTAEAAKVIENIQRDLNIALMNELSLIFHRLDLDTRAVLAVAGTKWNFLPFTPGLVGGHCIGVDPYYLVHKAEEIGYHPQLIAAGRRVNDFMPEFVAQQTIAALIHAGHNIQTARVLVMGLTFKENVRDVRNSKIAATIKSLQGLGVKVDGYDPLLTKKDLGEEFGAIQFVSRLTGSYEAVIIATPHDSFRALGQRLLALMKKPIVIDVKSTMTELKRRGVMYRSL